MARLLLLLAVCIAASAAPALSIALSASTFSAANCTGSEITSYTITGPAVCPCHAQPAPTRRPDTDDVPGDRPCAHVTGPACATR